jgi:hypothetical protein
MYIVQSKNVLQPSLVPESKKAPPVAGRACIGLADLSEAV